MLDESCRLYTNFGEIGSRDGLPEEKKAKSCEFQKPEAGFFSLFILCSAVDELRLYLKGTALSCLQILEDSSWSGPRVRTE